MSAVDVRSIDALESLRSELARFATEGREALQQMELEVAHTLELLNRERRKMDEVVWRCQQAHQRAQANLRNCINTPPDRDRRRPDCTRLAAEVRRAEAQLRESEDALRAILLRIQLVQQADAAYRQQAQRLQQMLDNDIPKARSFLGRKLDTLLSYISLRPASGSGFAVAVSGFSPPLPMNAASSRVVPENVSALPNVGEIVWIDRGIMDVPLSQIDTSDSSVHGPADFRQSSPHDLMLEGVRRLDAVIRPAVQQGADGDDFSAYDTQHDLDHAHGYRRVYDAFYGDEPIRLNKDGDRYTVEAGYHRLFVAQEAGLITIPAQIIEAQREAGTREGSHG